MSVSDQSISPYLQDQIRSLEKEEVLISEQRKAQLRFLAEAISNELLGTAQARITFVCTHNSRRSQLSELWLRAASAYHSVRGIRTYSGGTEASAFNQRMVDAVVRFGFMIGKTSDAGNPRYIAKLGPADDNEVTMFSKRYDDAFNPNQDFIAVMVCSQADKECPVVPGAVARISLPYEDPKAFDNTPQEQQAYDDKVRETGREMLYLARHVTKD